MAAVERFERRLRVARASDLAISGRSLEAAALLESEGRVPTSWAELDLLARIRVREGKLADAFKLWTQGAALDPQERRARICLASLERFAAAKFRRERQVYLLLWLSWSLAVVGVAVLVLIKRFR